VYEWKAGVLRAKTLGNQRKVMGLAYDPTSKVILQVGVKHVTFWCHEGRTLNYHKGIIGRLGVSQTFLAATYVGATPVVGSSDGHIYIFKDYKLEKAVQAHEGALYAMYSSDGRLFTGGKDGVIKVWDGDLECQSTFDALTTSELTLNKRIRSLCLSEDKTKVLIGTAGCEIFEMSALNGVLADRGPLTSGHYYGETWALSLHPKKPEFATVGDDGVVRVWSLDTRRCVRSVRLQTASRAVAYSPLGKHLVVGLGRGKKNDRFDGGFVVLDSERLSIIHEGKDANEWVCMAKYTPDGSILALTSQDSKIYLYNAKDMYSKRFVITTHRAVVTHVDFSEDSQYLQSADAAGAIYYTDMVSGINIPSALAVRDVSWKTWNLVVGWPVQGLWQGPQDGAQVLTVDRSTNQELLVAGDSYGRLKLYHYPVREGEAGYRKYRGHGQQIWRVLWTRDDGHVLTCGGKDKCVFYWRHTVDDSAESGDEAGESGDDEEIEFDCGLLDKNDPPPDHREKAKSYSGDGPWKGMIVPPSKLPKEREGPPKESLVLEYMHGYRGEDVRNSVRYNPQNELVWHGAAVGVIYDPILHKQSFFQGHRHDIISLAISDDGKYIATGELGDNAKICIWDSSAGMEIAVVPSVHQRGVASLSFSRDGHFLASVGHDRHHTVAVHRSISGLWSDVSRAAQEKTSSAKILFCLFCGESNFPIMLGGVKTASFLYMDGKSLRVKKGIFGANKKIQPLLCGTYLYSQDTVVTGTVTGYLYLWKDRRIIRQVPGHVGPVYAIEHAELGIVTGGKDGLVKIWNRDFVCTRQFSMMDCDPKPFHSSVHSVCSNRSFTKVVVGMKGGEVYEVAISSGRRVLVTEGHSKKQLHGLATNPANPDQYATVGDDGILRIWSLSKKKAIKRIGLDGSSRALAWSHDGSLLVVGFGGSGGGANVGSKDGAFAILGVANNFEIICEDRKAKMTVTDIKFSNDDGLVALVSEDGKVYIHDRSRHYVLKSMTSKLAQEPRSVDFSTDGSLLVAGTRGADMVVIREGDGYRCTAPNDYKDVEWATNTVPFGWAVQGIWPRNGSQEGYDILSVDRSHSAEKGLVAVSLTDGGLRLFNYPCQSTPNSDFNTAQGHGRAATKVRFTADDQYVVSLDGYCGCVLEYRVA